MNNPIPIAVKSWHSQPKMQVWCTPHSGLVMLFQWSKEHSKKRIFYSGLFTFRNYVDASCWFRELQNKFCAFIESIESRYRNDQSEWRRKIWFTIHKTNDLFLIFYWSTQKWQGLILLVGMYYFFLWNVYLIIWRTHIFMFQKCRVILKCR